MAKTFDAVVYGPGPTPSSKTVLAVPGTTVSDERYAEIMAAATSDEPAKKVRKKAAPAASDTE